MPGQIRGVAAHDPSDDPRAGKPRRTGNVAVRRHLPGGDFGHQSADPFDLVVGDPSHLPEVLSDHRRGFGRLGLGHHVLTTEVHQAEVGAQLLG